MRNRSGIVSLLIFSALILPSCKTLPEVNKPVAANSERILIREGEAEVEKKSISSVSRSIGEERKTLVRRHLEVIAATGDPLPIKGNEVGLLIDGPATFDRIFEAIEAAKLSVNIEIYIFEKDELGVKMKELLTKKQREGVQVRLIYDSVGSWRTPKTFFEEMREHGIKIVEFNPVDPTKGKLLALNNRNHRKLIIVDGRIAFTGGINISAVYSRGSAQIFRSEKNLRSESLQNGWRDTQIEVQGPAVAELQNIFFATWNKHSAEKLTEKEETYYPAISPLGDKIVRIISSSSEDNLNVIYRDFINAISAAQRSVHITMAYFSPDAGTLAALCDAAGRGVEVKLILPGFSDVWLVLEAGRAHYTTLLSCGVEIYQQDEALLHAKTVVIDGVWSTVGSTNMDLRSFLHNDELNVVVLGRDFGEKMETLFNRDLQKSTQVTLREWRRRPLGERMKQWLASLFAYWL